MEKSTTPGTSGDARVLRVIKILRLLKIIRLLKLIKFFRRAHAPDVG